MSGQDRDDEHLLGASTDPISNVTLLPGIQVGRHLHAILEGQLPLAAVPAFMHEVTHHRCFFGPIGATVCLLNLRARRRALLSIEGTHYLGSETGLDILDDFARYMVPLEVLRPLSEGLALFAEHDIIPGDAPVHSDVMAAVAQCCIPAGLGETLDEPLRAYLPRFRMHSAWLRRKTHLLMQPMRPDRGGYLPGYLTVRALWRAGIAENRRLLDQDLFLHYLISYVFGDFGVVALLLDADLHDAVIVKTVGDYLSQRLTRPYLFADLDARLDALEEARWRAGSDLEAMEVDDLLASVPNLGTDPDLWELGARRLADELEWLGRRGYANGDDSLARRFAQHDLWLMAQRDLVWLGRVVVQCTQSSRGTVRVQYESLQMTGPAIDPDRPAGTGLGSLDVFVNPWPWGRYVAVVASVDGETVLVSFKGDVSEVTRGRFRSIQIDVTDAQRSAAVLAGVLRSVLDSDPTNRVLLEHTRDSILEFAGRFYGGRSLLAVPDERLPEVLDLMRDDGLLPVLGSVRLVRALAWLGLRWRTAGLATLREWFEEDRDEHRCDMSLDDAIGRIAGRTEAVLGDPLVRCVDDTVICLV